MNYLTNLTFDEMLHYADRYGAFAFLKEWCSEYCERDNNYTPTKFIVLLKNSPAGDLILLEEKENVWQSSMKLGYAPNANEIMSKEWVVARKEINEKKKTNLLTLSEAVKCADFENSYIRKVDGTIKRLLKPTAKTIYSINLESGKVRRNVQFKKNEFHEPLFNTIKVSEIKDLSDIYSRNLEKAEEEIKRLEKDS